MTTCLAQFLTIFASPNLNYTAYQALLVETRMRLPHIEGSANLRTSGDYLRTTITLAEDSVKRSTGHNMEAIWAYIRDAMPSLPEELASLGKCDVANLPAGTHFLAHRADAVLI